MKRRIKAIEYSIMANANLGILSPKGSGQRDYSDYKVKYMGD